MVTRRLLDAATRGLGPALCGVVLASRAAARGNVPVTVELPASFTYPSVNDLENIYSPPSSGQRMANPVSGGLATTMGPGVFYAITRRVEAGIRYERHLKSWSVGVADGSRDSWTLPVNGAAAIVRLIGGPNAGGGADESVFHMGVSAGWYSLASANSTNSSLPGQVEDLRGSDPGFELTMGRVWPIVGGFCLGGRIGYRWLRITSVESRVRMVGLSGATIASTAWAPLPVRGTSAPFLDYSGLTLALAAEYRL